MSHQVEPTGTGTELPAAAPQKDPPRARDRRRLLVGGLVAGAALVTLPNRSALSQPVTACATASISLSVSQVSSLSATHSSHQCHPNV